MSLLDELASIPVQSRVISEQHNPNAINFVAGMSDPGEMIRCGYRPELRRMAGEQDREYAERIRPLVMALPQAERDIIMNAAIKRASIDTSNGRVNAAFALKPPWHGLGTVVDGVMSSADAIRLAGLDWKVIKQQLFFESPIGPWKQADGTYGIVRQDTGAYLGTVGSRYNPIQNSQGFEFLDGVIGEFGAKYESAGSIYGGKSVWMLAHMPSRRFAVNGDTIEPYALFTNCHDGTGAAWCFPTTVRVECANTFRTASRDKGKGLSIRHTGNVKSKISAARNALGLAVEGFEQFKDQAQSLVSKTADPKAFADSVLDDILDLTRAEINEGLTAVQAKTGLEDDEAYKYLQSRVERRGEILDDIMQRYESERCHPRGTAWAAFNAVTEHADHHTIGRQASDKTTRLSRRFESTLAGERDELKQLAFAKALAL